MDVTGSGPRTTKIHVDVVTWYMNMYLCVYEYILAEKHFTQ